MIEQERKSHQNQTKQRPKEPEPEPPAKAEKTIEQPNRIDPKGERRKEDRLTDPVIPSGGHDILDDISLLSSSEG